jgi:hypothetical protein
MYFKKSIWVIFIFMHGVSFGQKCIYDKVDYLGEDRSRSRAFNEPVHIGMVFHIVYSNAEQNIGNTQIYDQIDVLNRYFNEPDASLVVEEFRESVANIGIRFGLAAFDENGQPTSGITRTYTQHGAFGNLDFLSAEKGGKSPWNTEKYLNVWVCDLGGNTKGMTGSPNNPNGFDGVVVDFEAFGLSGTAKSPYDQGKTLVHEIGHYFGLMHLEGDRGGCDDDDGIADTPNQERSYSSCNLTSSTCGSLDMVQNFMSLGDDNCIHFFTHGQKEAMYSFYRQFRSNLTSELLELPLSNTLASSAKIRVYPNPFSDKIYIQGSYSNMDMFTVSGVHLAMDLNGPYVLTHHLEPGIYLLKIDGQRTFKLIKQP